MSPRRRSRRGRGLVWALVLVLLAGVVTLGVTGLEVLRARTALRTVAVDLDRLAEQVRAGDQAGARRTLADAQAAAARARDSTDGPQWWVSSALPAIGDDASAIQQVAEVADEVTYRVLPDVVSAAAELRPQALRPVDGRVDLDPLQAVAPRITRASARLAVLAQQAGRIDTSALAPQVADAVTMVQVKLDAASALVDRAALAARLLPPMLGADGPRRYLFVFQNNAEARATGGIPGSFAMVRADRGRLSMLRQSDAARLGSFRRAVLPVTGAERTLFGANLGRYAQDVTLTPDFPRSAELMRAMWQQRTRTPLDGVMSVDPVALSYLLQGTGAVKTARGVTLDAGNAVKILLSDVYADIPEPSRQNVFFDAAAQDTFTALTSGTGDAAKTLAGLVRAATEHRLLVWSSRPDEQRLLDSTALAGSLRSTDATTPQVGVFENAALPYKLDFYARSTTSVVASSCRAGRQQLTVTTSIASDVPSDYRRLSSYVAPRSPLLGKGTISHNVLFVGPVGSRFGRLLLNGSPVAKPPVTMLAGRPAITQGMVVRPGKTARVQLSLVTGRGQTGDPDLRVTPGARQSGVGTVSASACN